MVDRKHRIFNVAFRLIFYVMCCVAQFSLRAEQPPAFSDAASLRNYIYSHWNNTSDHRSLYSLALKEEKKFKTDMELQGIIAWLELNLKVNDWGVRRIKKARSALPENKNIQTWAFFIHNNRAHSVKDPDEFRDLMEEAIRIRPEYAEGYNYIGLRYQWANPARNEYALKYYNLAVENNYINADILANRGSVLCNLQQYDLADSDFKKSLEMNQKGSTYYALGSCLGSRKDTAGWADNLEKFLSVATEEELKSLEVIARTNLAFYTRYVSGDLARAKMHGETLLKKYPDHPDVEKWKVKYLWHTERKIKIDYSVNIPADEKAPSVLVILPVENASQSLLSVAIKPEPVSQKKVYHQGNSYLDLTYRVKPTVINVSAEYEYRPRSLKGNGNFLNSSDDGPERYNGKESNVIDPENPDVKNLLKEIAGNEIDHLILAKKIQEWMIQNLKYDKSAVYNNISDYLKNKKGECGGYALIFVNLARAAGIPSRRVFSPILNYPDAKTFGSHGTSEFYIQGKGWIPVDNTGNVLGITTTVFTLWREEPDKNHSVHYPDLKNIRLSYRDYDNRIQVIHGSGG